MRKAIIAIGVVALLAFGTAAYAHMSGWGGGPGYGGGYGMGPGYGHMYGGGPGYGHMGPGYGTDTEEAQKFLEDTADLRRELHEKRFDLREAYRTGDEEKAEAIEKEIDELREKLADKGGFEKGAWRGYGKGRGYGPRAGGYGYCGGPYGR
jgi:hypothetical protein